MKKIGSFSLQSGRMIVSDPCYEPNNGCNGMLRARKGIWNVYIRRAKEGSERLVKSLFVFHNTVDRKQVVWGDESFNVCVDSGQIGFFDRKRYRRKADAKKYKFVSEPLCEDDPWYSMCCDVTLDSVDSAASIPYGALSESGYGDGVYRCFVYKQGKETVAAKIEFLK